MTSTAIEPGLHEASTLPPGRYDVADLARSEWTKLRSLRSTLWSAVLVVVLGIGLGILATAEARAHWSTTTHAGFDPTQMSLIGVLGEQLVIGVLGVLVVTGEYGTGTIRATFSAAPRRPLVLVAKAAVFTVAALALSEVVAFLSFFVGQAMLSAPVTHASLSTPGALRAVVGSGLYVCVIGVLGVGLGVLIRHTAGAIGALVGVLLIFPAVVSALPQSLIAALQRYEPLQIGHVMITVAAVQAGARYVIHKFGPHAHHLVVVRGGPATFAPWVGFGVLCGYAAAMLVIGTILLVRRDA